MKSLTRTTVAKLLFGAVLCASSFVTNADTTASQLIVPFGPGGGADSFGREVAKLLGGFLSTPITVVNVPGATGNKGIAKLIDAPADGHTLAVLTADTFTVL
ncbi:MAG: tripartite tricarboxylate transporter substrate binding protein, partial [Caldimonas sp.]